MEGVFPAMDSLMQGPPHTTYRYRKMRARESPPESPLRLALSRPPLNMADKMNPSQATPSRYVPYNPAMLMFGEDPVGLEALIPVPEETATGSVSGVSPSLPPEANTHNIRDTATSLVEVYVCFYCEADFSTMEELKRHRAEHKMCSPDAKDMCTPTRPGDLAVITNSKALCRSSSMNKSSFTAALALHPVSKHRNLRVSTRKQISLDKIDIDRELPRSPTTPRTPKSLISQLSTRATDTASDADSDCGKTESLEEGSGRAKLNRLFTIEVSSLLGEKLMPHFTDVVGKESRNDEYENHCKTPIKNDFMERLRTRPSLPKVAYKPRRIHRGYHMYKFNKKQIREFMLKMKTGLNQKSRKLKKEMQPFSVDVHRLNKWDLVRFGIKKKQLRDLGFIRKLPKFNPEASKPSVFPSVPVLRENEETLRTLLGLRTNAAPIRRYLRNELNLSQVVSEDVLAEVMKQQVVVYKSLLSELTSSRSVPTGNDNSTYCKTLRAILCKPGGRVASEKAGIDCDSSSSRQIRRDRRKRSRSQDDSYLSSPTYKKAKLDFSPDNVRSDLTGVFSCGMCSFEVSVDNNVQKAVETHFADKHNIWDVVIKKDGTASLIVLRSPKRKTNSVGKESAQVDFIDLTLDEEDESNNNSKQEEKVITKLNTSSKEISDGIKNKKKINNAKPANVPKKVVVKERFLRSNSTTKVEGILENNNMSIEAVKVIKEDSLNLSSESESESGQTKSEKWRKKRNTKGQYVKLKASQDLHDNPKKGKSGSESPVNLRQSPRKPLNMKRETPAAASPKNDVTNSPVASKVPNAEKAPKSPYKIYTPERPVTRRVSDKAKK